MLTVKWKTYLSKKYLTVECQILSTDPTISNAAVSLNLTKVSIDANPKLLTQAIKDLTNDCKLHAGYFNTTLKGIK